MTLRTIAAGAAMLAGLILAAGPTQACDGRFGATCEPAAPAEAAAPGPAVAIHPTTRARTARPHRTAKVQSEPAKARHGKRARLALARHRRQPAPEPADMKPEPAAAPASAEIATPSPQQTAAARRFREFLNPQSFALAVNEDLRRPRLLAAHFSSDIADPDIVAAAWNGAVAPAAQEDAGPIIAHDQTTGDDSPSTAPVLTHHDATEVVRAAATDKEPARMSFVRWFFVAWGGVLTFASALRMAVG
jgi:hypothetical protein